MISANEHFATELVRREIAHAIAGTAEPASSAPSIVLACPEDERHEIGLLGLSLLLRERGIRNYYLGADVPQFDLMLAVQQTRSNALCLAATLHSSRASLTRAARDLVSSRLPAKLFFGGPAFRETGDGVEQAPGIGLPTRIGQAAAGYSGRVAAREGGLEVILVAGGTGLVGSGIVRELSRRGQRVAVLTRNAEKARKKFAAFDLEYREGDVPEPATLAAAVEGVEAVIGAQRFEFADREPGQGIHVRERR